MIIKLIRNEDIFDSTGDHHKYDSFEKTGIFHKSLAVTIFFKSHLLVFFIIMGCNIW